MDPSGTDFSMHHPNHHHPHYHHQTGTSSSSHVSRCPALRAAGEPRNYQLPTIASAARSNTQYDPVHTRVPNRDIWQSRSPQNWRPAMIPSLTHDNSMPGALFPGPTLPNQLAQPQQPPCPIPLATNAQNAPEMYQPQFPPFHQFRPTMHPAPRLLSQPSYQNTGGFAGSNPGQPQIRHTPSRHSHGLHGSGLSIASQTHHVPPMQIPTSGPSTTPRQVNQMGSYSNESMGPGQQLPNLLPHIYTQQDRMLPFTHQTAEPAHHANSLSAESSRPAANPLFASASTAPQRTNDQANRIVSPVEIRRASTAAMGRARRGMSLFAGSPPEWLGENALLLRRGDISLMDFVERFPGAMQEGENTMGARFMRGHSSGKRVASKKALASLQSVAVQDLPESERTCVICYNDFGVANPEGINEAPLRLPKCKHVFGDHCIKKWFQESDSCPYCRDKVHSEIQSIPTRRGHPNFRFIPSYHITAQQLPGYQGNGQSPSRDRDASESESSSQSGNAMSVDSPDRSSSQFPETGSNIWSGSGERRTQGPLQSGMRIPSWNASHERRSPPVEFDRRRRTRHRVRFTPPSTRPSVLGGSTSNGASPTSVRPSRSSRSRSPLDHASTRLNSSSRRSLTNSPEQYHWNGSPSPNSNHTGAVPALSQPSVPSYDVPSFAFQSQPFVAADDFYHGLASPSPDAIPANEHPSGLPQMRSDMNRFPSPPTAVSEIFSLNQGQGAPNQYTSYQQS